MASKPKPRETDDEQLAAMVQYATGLQHEIAALDEVWKEKTKRLRKLTEEDLPTLMDELGYDHLSNKKLGFSVKVDDKWQASVPRDKREDVCDMARELGHEALIGHTLLLKFRHDEKEFYEAAKKTLIDAQLPFEDQLEINTGSWKAAVKNLVGEGAGVDLNRACVSRLRVAIIKLIK